MTTYKVGDHVTDWTGRRGIIETIRTVNPTYAGGLAPYQRVSVVYPGSERWTEGAATSYSPQAR